MEELVKIRDNSTQRVDQSRHQDDTHHSEPDAEKFSRWCFRGYITVSDRGGGDCDIVEPLDEHLRVNDCDIVEPLDENLRVNDIILTICKTDNSYNRLVIHEMFPYVFRWYG